MVRFTIVVGQFHIREIKKSKLKIMKLNTFILQYAFLVLINLPVSELYHTLKCDHSSMRKSNVKLNNNFI